MVMEKFNTKMVPNLEVNGRMIEQLENAKWHIVIMINLMESIRIVKLMGLEFINLVMVMFIKVNLKMVNLMEREI